MTRPIRAAGVLLLTRATPRQFLLMRHADRWDLPKGHCDGDETFRDAALRELTEETGFTASTVKLDPDFAFDLRYDVRYRDSDRPRPKHVRYFLGFVDEAAQPVISEHLGYAWFPWQPPHRIQQQTIDPLLAAVQQHLGD